ncbi:MAG: hypothetical protein JSV61_15325 [Anaerolineales bacterium]|nr:MAG: hypothetical protein JSV61_15325 [Anaerolineales bacterium]
MDMAQIRMNIRFVLPLGLLLLYILVGCKGPQQSTSQLQASATAEAPVTIDIEPTATAKELVPSPTAVQTEIVEISPGTTATQPAPTESAAPALTASPEASPTPQPTSTEAPATDSTGAAVETTSDCTNLATFSKDITIPDDTLFQQGASFEKTWELYNAGTCAWGPGYQVVFAYGDPLGSSQTIPLPNTPPNALARVSADMVAPSTPGQYTGNWQLQTANGERFGVGLTRSNYFWVKINVSYVGSGETSGTGTSSTSPSPAPVTTDSNCSYTTNSSFIDEIADQINQIRQSYGLDPLTVDAQLSAAAMDYSLDMGCNNRVDFTRHTDSRGGRWYERIAAQGYSYSAALEIVWTGNPAYGGTPQAAVNWWMNSKIHRDNILNADVTEMGIAYAQVEGSDYIGYCTVDFAKP